MLDASSAVLLQLDVGPPPDVHDVAYGAGFEDVGRDEVAERGLVPVGVTAGPVNDGLIAAVRGDDLPATARTSLQSHVSRLRAQPQNLDPQRRHQSCPSLDGYHVACDETRHFIQKWIGLLLDHGAAHGTDLVRTLSAYLESGGSHNATAH